MAKDVSQSQGPISEPEIVIGLIGPVGCDLTEIEDSLKAELKRVKYSSDVVRLRDLLHEIPAYRKLPLDPAYERYVAHMNAGTELREKLGAGDALAKLAIGKMRQLRKRARGEKKPCLNIALYFIL